MNALEMRQKAATIMEQMKALIVKAGEEKRDLNGEEIGSWQKMKTDYDGLVAQIEVVETTERIERSLSQSLGPVAGAQGGASGGERRVRRNSEEYRRAYTLAMSLGRERLGTGDRTALENGLEEQGAYRNAYWSYMREGFDGLADEGRKELRSGFQAATPEMRALSVGLATAGGYLVPDEDQMAIVDAMKAYGGMLTVSQVLNTNTGAEIPIPTSDDTSNVGEQVGENAAVTEQDITVGQKALQTYIFSTKMIKASLALIQDAPGWFESWLRGRMAIRLARILNQKWTTGTGAATIEGVITGATLGKTAAAAAAITWDELVDLEVSVDPMYRVGARWMMHDSTLGYLRKLKDGSGRPLFFQEIFMGERTGTILTYPWTINQDMATITNSAKTILFGNFQNYLIRNVSGMVSMRLVERYAEYGQVAFLGFSRHGGLLIDAGTNPVKYLQQLA